MQPRYACCHFPTSKMSEQLLASEGPLICLAPWAGLIFALELNETSLNPCQVFAVVPGSPASLADAVLPGDEVRSSLPFKQCALSKTSCKRSCSIMHSRFLTLQSTAGDQRRWCRGRRKQFD